MTTVHALGQARVQRVRRLPLYLGDERVGSVAAEQAPVLQRWPHWVRVESDRVVLTMEAGARDDALARMNDSLRAEGLIRAWRNEPFALWSPGSGQPLARLERASARFWGTLTLGAHCNGYVAGPDGRPSHLWVARRSATKATDPGMLDNLIGGGVPAGQSPWETVVREGWEEAGLTAQQMQAARPGRVIELDRDIPEGRQWERLHVFDLALPPEVQPTNQDGEVAALMRVGAAEAVQQALGEEMTVDAALVTLDFGLRWQLLPPALQGPLQQQLEALLAGTKAPHEPGRPA